MTRVLYDAFFHMMPGHRIGDDIVVGGYAVNFGRYSPNDCFHPNGLMALHADLAGEYELRPLLEPYSDASLYDADILLVPNPDYPLYEHASPYRWTPRDVDALVRFLERGGGVLLMVNSFLSRPDYWEENFDLERVSLLFDRLGLRWDPNFMSDDKTIELARSGTHRVGYGQGGRVWQGQLPVGVTPLITRDDNIYGFQTQVGKGKLAVVGDTGSLSNGLMCFPGYDNAAFFRNLFQQLKPAWHGNASTRWNGKRFFSISCAPGKDGISESLIRSFRPDAEWMEDHHYRHLTWSQPLGSDRGPEIWKQLPLPIQPLSHEGTLSARLKYLTLDGERPGPECPISLTAKTTRQGTCVDLHVIGRTHSKRLVWNDLFENPAPLLPLGTVDQVHTMFELRAVCDREGRPLSARWNQGQILYARSSLSAHYGYEIVLSSASGLILPTGTR